MTFHSDIPIQKCGQPGPAYLLSILITVGIPSAAAGIELFLNVSAVAVFSTVADAVTSAVGPVSYGATATAVDATAVSLMLSL